MKRNEKTRKAKRSHSQFKNAYNFVLNDTKWLSIKNYFQKSKGDQTVGCKGRDHISQELDRAFHFSCAKSQFRIVTSKGERFCHFTDLFLVVSKLSSAQCSRSHNERKISSEFSPATSRRDSWAPRVSILLWLFPVGLRLILGCLTSSLPPSSCSHVKTIFSSTDWSVRRFVCVQKMDFTQIFILKFPAIPYSNTFSMIFDFWPIFYISPFVLQTQCMDFLKAKGERSFQRGIGRTMTV